MLRSLLATTALLLAPRLAAAQLLEMRQIIFGMD